MSKAALRASLKLWRWRLHRHEAKLRKAKAAKEKARLKALLSKDRARVRRRLSQLEAKQPHKHQDWMPGAHIHKASSPGTPWQIDCPPRGVLHTTEGPGDATGTLDAKRAWPHFQVEKDGRITQYYPLSVGARALVHDGPPTNGAHCFQIEVCGYASRPKWPEEQKQAVRKVMRFLEDNGGVARECNVNFKSPRRLTPNAWLSLRGWCGHVHVPGNDHTDPGRISIEELL